MVLYIFALCVCVMQVGTHRTSGNGGVTTVASATESVQGSPEQGEVGLGDEGEEGDAEVEVEEEEGDEGDEGGDDATLETQQECLDTQLTDKEIHQTGSAGDQPSPTAEEKVGAQGVTGDGVETQEAGGEEEEEKERKNDDDVEEDEQVIEKEKEKVEEESVEGMGDGAVENEVAAVENEVAAKSPQVAVLATQVHVQFT
jgi:hypothetical protein